MPIISQCSAPGCSILTIGPFCIEHERRAVEVGAGALPAGKPGVEEVDDSRIDQ
jgi:hypothetical protein